MTLKEFYEQIDGSYEDTLHRLTSEALVHRFALKYPADPSFAQLREAVAASLRLRRPHAATAAPRRDRRRARARYERYRSARIKPYKYKESTDFHLCSPFMPSRQSHSNFS